MIAMQILSPHYLSTNVKGHNDISRMPSQYSFLGDFKVTFSGAVYPSAHAY